MVDARSSPSPTLPENEFDYEEEDAINLDNNDVNYEEEDQQFHKIETHMPGNFESFQYLYLLNKIF